MKMISKLRNSRYSSFIEDALDTMTSLFIILSILGLVLFAIIEFNKNDRLLLGIFCAVCFLVGIRKIILRFSIYAINDLINLRNQYTNMKKLNQLKDC